MSISARAVIRGVSVAGVVLLRGVHADAVALDAVALDAVALDAVALDAVALDTAAPAAPFTPAAITFEGPVARALPDVGRSLATGDFDGDGALDAAVLVPGSVAVWPNVAGSREEQPVVTPLVAGGAGGNYPGGPRVADMDGDGLLDLVISGGLAPNGCGATVLRGLGDGSFELGGSALHPPYEGTTVSSCQALEVADFNADGSPDIAVLYAYIPPESSALEGLVDVFLGSGAGAFNWSERYALTAPGEQPFMSMTMASADFDGDGALDLVVGAEVRWLSGPSRWRLQTLRGDGTGQFSAGPMRDFSVPDLDVTSMRAADLTGDGLSEVLIGTSLATGSDVGYEFPVLVFMNEGEAGFAEPVEVAREQASIGLLAEDFTGDGVRDLLISGAGDRLTLLPGDGLGGFGLAERFFVSGWIGEALAADVDADGHSDLLIVDGQGQLLVAAGQVSGKPLALPVLTRPSALQTALPTLVDLNRDGILDVLSASTGRVDVLFGTGSGGFTEGGSIATSSYPWRAPVLDLNGDGLLDLVAADGDGFSAVLGTESGRFAEWSPAPGTPLREITASASGDVDADGDVDLVVVEYVRDVELYVNDGSGHFTLSQTFPTSTSVNDLALVDFDRDGHLDVFIGAASSCIALVDGACVPGQSVIRFGSGTGSFERSVAIDVHAPRILTEDVTGDGLLDLLAPEALLVGRGDGTFQPPQLRPNAAARELALADLNADGRLDLLSLIDDSLYVAEGDGTGEFAERRLILRPGYSAVLAVGDLTGSGLPDVLTSRTIYLDVIEASELITLANTTAVACGL